MDKLPLWHFFHDIEKFLSYERWIDKYRLFLEALLDSNTISYDKDWKHLKQFVKILYLQDIRDEPRFDELLNAAVAREEQLLESFFRAEKQPASSQQTKPEDAKQEKKETTSNESAKPADTKTGEEILPDEKQMDEPPETTEGARKYYQPPATKPQSIESFTTASPNYLQTDEYFSVTRRQMIKGWQFLRHKEKSNRPENIDIESTILQIAKDGLFIEPRYLYGYQNRSDTLIIFADYRGSMTPFHELSNRLIQTARSEGGHPRAPVFYFQNYPVGYVYRQPNLTRQAKVKEALLTANRNFTLGIVISDAGAARGNADSARIKSRIEITKHFLEDLNKYCAHTIWLNPMPAHRWKGTAAAAIKDEVMLMAPILDDDTYSFQDTLRTILKQHQKFQKIEL